MNKPKPPTAMLHDVLIKVKLFPTVKWSKSGIRCSARTYDGSGVHTLLSIECVLIAARHGDDKHLAVFYTTIGALNKFDFKVELVHKLQL